MRVILCLTALVIRFAVPAYAQEAVGPVAPRAATSSLKSYEENLGALLKTDATRKAHNNLSSADARALMAQAEKLRDLVDGLSVGPVAPKPAGPAPLAPAPKPGTPARPAPHPPSPAAPKPTRKEFDDAILGLRGALRGAAQKQPRATLPPDEERELQSLLTTLHKASEQ